MRKTLRSAIAALAGLAGLALGAAEAGTVTGAGSTFVFPILSKWAAAYAHTAPTNLNYQSIGSGGGIAQIKAKTVVFGATDMPMKAKDLDALGMVMFPVVNGADVPIVNISGIKTNQLVLDGPTLANIYLGHIARWNDPAIKKLNPGVNLPDQAILVVHRSDGSGTTFIWANYLSKVSEEWNKNVGAATSVDWPTGVGAKGNEGVSGNVAQSAGSIGYVEYAYAKQNHIATVRMINREGGTVTPSAASFAAAASGVDWGHLDHFYVILTNASGKESWPIAGSTFVLMYKQPVDPAASAEALRYFKWSLEKGASLAGDLDYVPLPQSAVQAIEASWKQIQGSGM